ncbi:MAG: type VI secretion protein IcmF/TssM N-terminal domain-containing protein [Planctomycetota bacterium]
MLGRLVGTFRELPLLYQAVIVVAGSGVAAGLASLWNTKVAIAVLVVIALVALALFVIQWVLKRFEKRRSAELASALESGDGGAGVADEERRQAIAEVREQWNRAVNELKATGMNLYSLPWYMLIGEPACGKSTTLKNSGLEFPVGTEALSGAGGTRNCDWWFTNEAVILDTAGRFTFEERNAPDAQEWKEFLGLLRRYRPRCPINGVIVAIPATSLLGDTPSEMEQKAKTIRDKLTQLQQELEVQFPVYIVVTKCDLVLGFTEFFQRLPALEQRQLFGWSKPAPYDEAFRPEAWPGVFRGVRQRLHLWRNRFLADDPEAPDVDRLYAFPDEFGALEEPVQRYLGEIFVENRYLDPVFFRGLYFSSGLQKGKPIVKACANLLRAAAGGPDEADLSSIFQKSTAFFVRDFYRKKLFKERGLVQPTRLALKRRRTIERVGYGAAAGVGLLLLGLLIYGGVVQNRGVSGLSGALDEFEKAVAETVARPTLGFADLPLAKATALRDAICNAEAKGSLAPGLLVGFVEEGRTLPRLGDAYRKLVESTTFRLLGDRAIQAFDKGRPRNWPEQEAYHQALQLIVMLTKEPAGDPTVPAARAERQALPWTLQPLTALLLGRGALSADEVKILEEQYQQLLDVCSASRLGRPQLRDAFFRGQLQPVATDAEIQARLGRLIADYASYWQLAADGEATIVGLRDDGSTGLLGVDAQPGVPAPDREVVAGAAWIRACAIDRTCETAYTEVLGLFDSRGLGAVTELSVGYERVKRWVDDLSKLGAASETFFARIREAQGYVAFTQSQALGEHHTTINKLRDTCAERLQALAALSPTGEEWGYAAVMQQAGHATSLASKFGGQSDAVRERFFSADRRGFALSSDSTNATGPYKLVFTAEQGTRSEALESCYVAVRDAVVDESHSAPERIHALDQALSTRLASLDQALGAARKRLEDPNGTFQRLSEHVSAVTELARQVLVARSLVGYPRVVVQRGPQQVLADFCPQASTKVEVLRLARAWTVEARHTREVAERVLRHGDSLLGRAEDPDLARLLTDPARQALRAQAQDLLRQYFEGYAQEWDAQWREPLDPTRGLEDLDFDKYREALRNGFGLAASGSFSEALRRAVETLRRHVDFSDIPQFHSLPEGKLPSDPYAPLGALDSSLGELRRKFAQLLQAYDPDTLPALATAFEKFRDGMTRLSEPSRFREQLLEKAGEITRRDQIAACAQLFVDRPALEQDLIGRRVNDIVSRGQALVEDKLLAEFRTLWHALGERFAGQRLWERAPFADRVADNGTQRPARDIDSEGFNRFLQAIREADDQWGVFYRDAGATKISLRLEPDPNLGSVRRFIDSVLGLGRHMYLDGTAADLKFTFTANLKEREYGELRFPPVGQYAIASETERISGFNVVFGNANASLNATGTVDGSARTKEFQWLYRGGSDAGRLVLTMVRGQTELSDHPFPIEEGRRKGWLALARALWDHDELHAADKNREVWLLLHELRKSTDEVNVPIALHLIRFPEGRGLPERPDFGWTGWATR